MKNERIEGTDMCDFKDIVQINKNFQKSINMRLDYNKAERHLRGGMATKLKYSKIS